MRCAYTGGPPSGLSPSTQQPATAATIISQQLRLHHCYMTVMIASEMHSIGMIPMHFNASRSLTQPLLDCILYLTQHLYDRGNLPSSASQFILGEMSLYIKESVAFG